MREQELDFSGIEQVPMSTFTEKAYLDYSMYVILDRALPHIGDGLKPVQRRITYAMSDLGLSAASKPKKAARTVGDVLGKFHPHGDSACYEAMVHMAQGFSYRYPIVDGHGNWGSQDDPKSFAAMRYTEARLTKYAQLLLGELGQGTVDWTPNFDGTLMEPERLPARLPNLLLNGTSGIAVGMSTDVPPHNLREVAAALLHLLDEPDASTAELLEYVKGPDFPTGGELVSSRDEIAAVYATGSGTLRVRASCDVDNDEIVIQELPFQTSGAKVLEQIAAQMRAKKLPWVQDLRDESDHENPTRLVITARSKRVDFDALLNHLYATTDLERTVRVNCNVIGRDGRPKVFGLKALLTEWLAFRFECVRRRLAHRLEQVTRRLHILDGLLIAFLNIDAVIKIIRTEDKPKPILMQRFKLSDEQAEAILELKLRHLARLEEIRIKAEQEKLAAEQADIEAKLKSKSRLTKLVKSEIAEVTEQLGDERRTRLVERAAARALAENELVPSDPVTVVLSERGWVRAAKGHEIDPETLSYRSGDAFRAAARGASNQMAIFMDSTGRAYSLGAHALPSARGQGEPLSGHVNPPDGASFRAALIGNDDDQWVLATSAAYGFIVRLKDLHSRNKAGKAILKVPAGAVVLSAVAVNSAALSEDSSSGGRWIAAASTDGRLLVFPVEDLPQLARGKGNKILAVPAKGEVAMADVCMLAEGQSLKVTAGQRQMTLKPADLEYYMGERGRRGTALPRGWRRVERLVAG